MGWWLEPGAGDGNIIKAVREIYPAQKWKAAELEPSHEAVLRTIPNVDVVMGDFLAKDSPLLQQQQLFAGGTVPIYPVALGNPPFSLAMQFIERAMLLAETVVFLLRLNFLGSVERHPFWREHLPSLYMLPNRPQFMGTGSDSIEYAWFAWGPNETPGTFQLLDLTPLEVRKAQKSHLMLAGKRDLKRIGVLP
jgi:hypothetical protein